MRFCITILILLSFPLAKAQVVLAADSLGGLPGAQVSLPVRTSGFSGIVSFQGTVEWDTAVVAFAGLSQFGLTGMNAGSFGTALAPSGKLTFSWDDPSFQGVGLADSSVLFAVVFELVGMEGAATAVDFSNNPTPLEFIDPNFNSLPYQTQSGTISIEDTSLVVSGANPAQPSAMSIFPNPIEQHSVLEMEGDLEADMLLEWGDLAGKNYQREKWRVVEGKSRFPIGEKMLPGLAPGIYWIKCTSENQSFRQTLIVE